jgi:hypothetical protein
METELIKMSEQMTTQAESFLVSKGPRPIELRPSTSKKTFQDVQTYIGELTARFIIQENHHGGIYESPADVSSEKFKLFEDKKSVFNSACILFGFFFPLDTHTELTENFWTSVFCILTVRTKILFKL